MHLSCRKATEHFFLRTISFILLICVSTTELARSQPSIGIQTHSPEHEILSPKWANFEIPKELGVVKEIIPAHSSKSESPLVLHIQDAHGSYEAQVNIKKIIAHLVKDYGFSLILTEGAAQELQPKLFRIFKDQSLNLKIADALAKVGELTGAELFLLEAPEKVKAQGIEEPATYAENLESFRDLISSKKESQKFIKTLRSQIELLGSRALNKNLREFLRSWQSWREEKLDLAGFLHCVKSTADRALQVNLEDEKAQAEYPMLVRYFKAQVIESKINFEQAETERQKLITFLESNPSLRAERSNLRSEIALSPTAPRNDEMSAIISRLRNWKLEKGISDWTDELPRYFLEHLYEIALPGGFNFKDYPSLVAVWAALIFQSELEPERLFKEIDQVTNSLFDGLIQNAKERDLVLLFKDSIVLEKLLLLQLTRPEYEELRQNSRPYQPKYIWKRLDAIAPPVIASPVRGEAISVLRLPRRPNGLLAMTESAGTPLRNDVKIGFISKQAQEALHFYRTAKKREDFLVSNTKRQLETHRTRKAILVTGGFHSEGLKKQFSDQNYSYIEIAPRITSFEGIDRVYHQAALEKSQVMQNLRMAFPALDPLIASLTHKPYRLARLASAINDIGVGTQQLPEFNLSALADVYQITAQPDKSGKWILVSRSEIRNDSSNTDKVLAPAERSELRDVELQEALEHLAALFPVRHRPSVQDLKQKAMLYHNADDQFRIEEKLPIRIALNPGFFRKYLPKKQQPNPSLSLFYVYSKNFESIQALYGNRKTKEVIVAEGPVSYFATTSKEEYETKRSLILTRVMELAERADNSRMGSVPTDGARWTIVAAPNANTDQTDEQYKNQVIVDSASAVADILGNEYIASPGRQMGSKEMDLITKTVLDVDSRRAAYEGVTTGSLKRNLPPAVGTSEKRGGFPMERWKISGVGITAAILAIAHHAYAKKKIFGGSIKTLRIGIFGNGHISSQVTRTMMEDYPLSTGFEFTEIIDPKTAGTPRREIYFSEGALPRALIKRINAHIDEGKLFASFKIFDESLHSYADEGIQDVKISKNQRSFLGPSADIFVLDSPPDSFNQKEAERFVASHVKVVVEANPLTATPEAVNYLHAHGVLFVSQGTANIGPAYFAWHALLYTLAHQSQTGAKSKYYSQAQIEDRIISHTSANMTLFLDHLEKGSAARSSFSLAAAVGWTNGLFIRAQSLSGAVADFNKEFPKQIDSLSTKVFEVLKHALNIPEDKSEDVFQAAEKFDQKQLKKQFIHHVEQSAGDPEELRPLREIALRMFDLIENGIPIVLALKMAVFEQVYSKFISSRESINKLKADFENPDNNIRMTAVFLLGQAQHSGEELKEIIDLMGKRIREDSDSRVRAEAIQVLGTLRNPPSEIIEEIIQYLKEATFDVTKLDSRVRRWAFWALSQYSNYIDWNQELEKIGTDIKALRTKLSMSVPEAMKSFDENQEPKEGLAEQVKFVGTQILFFRLGKLYFKKAVVYQILKNPPHALVAYRETVKCLQYSQREGNVFPLQTQIYIAEIHMLVSEIQATLEKQFTISAFNVLVKGLDFAQVSKLLGAGLEDVYRLPDENDIQSFRKRRKAQIFKRLTMVRMFRKSYLQQIFKLQGKDEDDAESLAIAMDNFLTLHWETKKENNDGARKYAAEKDESERISDFTLQDTLDEQLIDAEIESSSKISLRKKSQEGKSEGKRFNAKRFGLLETVLAEKEGEILTAFESVEQLIGRSAILSSEEKGYLRLLLLIASNIYYRFGYLRKEIINAIGNQKLPQFISEKSNRDTPGQAHLRALFKTVGLLPDLDDAVALRSELRQSGDADYVKAELYKGGALTDLDAERIELVLAPARSEVRGSSNKSAEMRENDRLLEVPRAYQAAYQKIQRQLRDMRAVPERLRDEHWHKKWDRLQIEKTFLRSQYQNVRGMELKGIQTILDQIHLFMASAYITAMLEVQYQLRHFRKPEFFNQEKVNWYEAKLKLLRDYMRTTFKLAFLGLTGLGDDVLRGIEQQVSGKAQHIRTLRTQAGRSELRAFSEIEVDRQDAHSIEFHDRAVPDVQIRIDRQEGEMFLVGSNRMAEFDSAQLKGDTLAFVINGANLLRPDEDWHVLARLQEDGSFDEENIFLIRVLKRAIYSPNMEEEDLEVIQQAAFIELGKISELTHEHDAFESIFYETLDAAQINSMANLWIAIQHPGWLPDASKQYPKIEPLILEDLAAFNVWLQNLRERLKRDGNLGQKILAVKEKPEMVKLFRELRTMREEGDAILNRLRLYDGLLQKILNRPSSDDNSVNHLHRKKLIELLHLLNRNWWLIEEKKLPDGSVIDQGYHDKTAFQFNGDEPDSKAVMGWSEPEFKKAKTILGDIIGHRIAQGKLEDMRRHHPGDEAHLRALMDDLDIQDQAPRSEMRSALVEPSTASAQISLPARQNEGGPAGNAGETASKLASAPTGLRTAQSFPWSAERAKLRQAPRTFAVPETPVSRRSEMRNNDFIPLSAQIDGNYHTVQIPGEEIRFYQARLDSGNGSPFGDEMHKLFDVINNSQLPQGDYVLFGDEEGPLSLTKIVLIPWEDLEKPFTNQPVLAQLLGQLREKYSGENKSFHFARLLEIVPVIQNEGERLKKAKALFSKWIPQFYQPDEIIMLTSTYPSGETAQPRFTGLEMSPTREIPGHDHEVKIYYDLNKNDPIDQANVSFDPSKRKDVRIALYTARPEFKTLHDRLISLMPEAYSSDNIQVVSNASELETLFKNNRPPHLLILPHTLQGGEAEAIYQMLRKLPESLKPVVLLSLEDSSVRHPFTQYILEKAGGRPAYEQFFDYNPLFQIKEFVDDEWFESFLERIEHTIAYQFRNFSRSEMRLASQMFAVPETPASGRSEMRGKEVARSVTRESKPALVTFDRALTIVEGRKTREFSVGEYLDRYPDKNIATVVHTHFKSLIDLGLLKLKSQKGNNRRDHRYQLKNFSKQQERSLRFALDSLINAHDRDRVKELIKQALKKDAGFVLPKQKADLKNFSGEWIKRYKLKLAPSIKMPRGALYSWLSQQLDEEAFFNSITFYDWFITNIDPRIFEKALRSLAQEGLIELKGGVGHESLWFRVIKPANLQVAIKHLNDKEVGRGRSHSQISPRSNAPAKSGPSLPAAEKIQTPKVVLKTGKQESGWADIKQLYDDVTLLEGLRASDSDAWPLFEKLVENWKKAEALILEKIKYEVNAEAFFTRLVDWYEANQKAIAPRMGVDLRAKLVIMIGKYAPRPSLAEELRLANQRELLPFSRKPGRSEMRKRIVGSESWIVSRDDTRPTIHDTQTYRAELWDQSADKPESGALAGTSDDRFHVQIGVGEEEEFWKKREADGKHHYFFSLDRIEIMREVDALISENGKVLDLFSGKESSFSAQQRTVFGIGLIAESLKANPVLNGGFWGQKLN